MKQNQEEIETLKPRIGNHRQRNHDPKKQDKKSGSHRQKTGGGYKTLLKIKSSRPNSI